MYRSVLIGIALNLLFLNAAAQSTFVDSTKAMLSKLSKGKQDTNKVKMLLWLGDRMLNKPPSTKLEFDSMLDFYTRARELAAALHSSKLENEAAIGLASYDIKKGDTVMGKAKFRLVINKYHQERNLTGEAKAWKQFGAMLYYNSSGDPATALDAYEHERLIYQELKVSHLIADAYKDKGVLLISWGKFDEGLIELITAVKLYKALGNLNRRFNESQIGRVYWQQGNIEKSLFYRIEALNTSILAKDDLFTYEAYHELGDQYYNLGKYAESLNCFQQALKICKKIRHTDYYYVEIVDISNCGIRTKSPKEILNVIKNAVADMPPLTDLQKANLYNSYATIYRAEKKFNEAERNYLKMMSLFDKLYKANEYGRAGYVYFQSYNISLGYFYLEFEKFAKARPYFDRLLKSPDNVTVFNISKAHYGMFKVDSASKNYISAINHYQINRKLHDSIFNAKSSDKVAELTVKYNTEQRLKDIKLLQSQRHAQDNALKSARVLRNITFCGIAALLILAGVIFNGYRNKQHTNKRLQQQQEEINNQYSALEKLSKQQNHLLIEKDLLITEKDELLNAKNWLLKEVHHRVKNNLQIVTSLLSTQSAYLQSSDALEAIRESQNRVQSISLIHQKLYNDSNVSSIDMPAYVAELVAYLKNAFNVQARGIRFEQIVEHLEIDLSQTVPIGLILNEAITNAIKYAFTEKGGEVIVALQAINENIILLTISDNGIGLPKDFDIQKTTSLGMEMMKALSRQLGGDFKITSKAGTTVTVEFQLERLLLGNIDKH